MIVIEAFLIGLGVFVVTISVIAVGTKIYYFIQDCIKKPKNRDTANLLPNNNLDNNYDESTMF